MYDKILSGRTRVTRPFQGLPKGTEIESCDETIYVFFPDGSVGEWIPEDWDEFFVNGHVAMIQKRMF